MSGPSEEKILLPRAQLALRDRCLHPSGTFVEFPLEDVETSISARFEKITRMHPDCLAVQDSDQTWTYAALNSRANQIARLILAQRGPRAESVGLLLANNANLQAAILGVLKAGKFVTLLDPSFPNARIAAILEDTRTGMMIVDRQNTSLANEVAGNNRRVLEMDSVDQSVLADDPGLLVSPKALAFIFHTSGSTGQPKGVMQNHRNILHNVMLRTNIYHVHERDRCSLLSAGTSNAVINALLALLNGAATLPFDVQREGVDRLAAWLSVEKISISFISVPLFRNLAESLERTEGVQDLRVVRLVSETIHRADIDLYRRHFSPDCILVNGLASTETGPLTKHLMGPETEFPGDDAPVGYALQDKYVLLLSDAGNEVGYNEIGEITVRSRYLSPGYWRRPDLTKVKFRRDMNDRTMRFYLSGDLGLRFADDCLVYKGRKDFRIKIRGYGVETAEVEKRLRDFPGIKEAVVVARENESGESQLVGYFSADNEPAHEVTELRRFLKEKLPEYMVPSSFVRLQAIPLTFSGKIDRQALPDPEMRRLTSGSLTPRRGPFSS